MDVKKIRVKWTSNYGGFMRAECGTNPVSYEMPTPTASQRSLGAIYAKTAEFRWKVLRLYMLKRPTMMSFTSNEVKSLVNLCPEAGHAMHPGTVKDRLQRHNLILRDCCFGIEAVPVLIGPRHPDNNEAKHVEMMKRRLKRGACFYRPYMGRREFPAEMSFVDHFEPVDVSMDLGWMPLEIPTNGSPVRLFKAELVSGCLEVPHV